MSIRRISVTVSGKVQGVGFRYFTSDCAQSLNLTGWVRNQQYRQVEIAVQGESANIDVFLENIRRGPQRARVESVTVADLPVDTAETDFRIVH